MAEPEVLLGDLARGGLHGQGGGGAVAFEVADALLQVFDVAFPAGAGGALVFPVAEEDAGLCLRDGGVVWWCWGGRSHDV